MDRHQTVGALFGVPGQALWVRQLGGAGTDEGLALATDTENNIIAVGNFGQTLQAGNVILTSAGGEDFYVAKLNGTTGDVIWAKQFGGNGNDSATAVSVDNANNLYVSGRFEGSVDFGGGAVQSAGSSDAFVLKLASDGKFVWVRAVGGTTFDTGTTAATKNGHVVLAGEFTGSLTVGGKTLTAAGGPDVFVYELTSDGVGTWVTSFGHADADVPTTIAIDSSDNVIVGGTSRTSSTVIDMFVAKLSSGSGMELFSKPLGSASIDNLSALVIDASDNILITGGFSGSLDLGNGIPLMANSNQNIFVAKYSLAGSFLWGKSFDGAGSEQARAVAIDGAGDLVIAGDFCGTISFGGPPMTSASGCSFTDAFVVRLAASDGSFQKSVRAGGTGSERGAGVTLTQDGRFYVTGDFDGFAEFGGQALTPVGLNDSYVLAFAPL